MAAKLKLIPISYSEMVPDKSYLVAFHDQDDDMPDVRIFDRADMDDFFFHQAGVDPGDMTDAMFDNEHYMYVLYEIA